MTQQKEALPWWFFGIIGGVLSVWLGEKFLAGRMGLPALPGADAPRWMTWDVRCRVFHSRRNPRRRRRLVHHQAGECRAWVRSFARSIECSIASIAIYGRTVGGLLRLSAIVVAVYGGLLVLTYFEFVRTPTGFIPQQDKGYLLLNVQLPDSASVERTQKNDRLASRKLPAK